MGRRSYGAIGLLAVAAAAIVAAPNTAAAPAPPPQLSIDVTDGQTQVHSNTDVNYTTEVSNHGTASVTAELVLATPTYVTIMHAPGAKVAGHTATWHITVRAGHSISRTAAAHIGTIAKGDYRVSTLASLYPGKATSGIPLVRTAVANTIAGVADPARTVKNVPAQAARTRHSSGPNWVLFAGVPGAAVVLLALAALLWRRRRRAGRDSATADPDDLVMPADLAAAFAAHRRVVAAEPAAEPTKDVAVAPHRPRPAPVPSGRHHAVDPD